MLPHLYDIKNIAKKRSFIFIVISKLKILKKEWVGYRKQGFC